MPFICILHLTREKFDLGLERKYKRKVGTKEIYITCTAHKRNTRLYMLEFIRDGDYEYLSCV